MVTGIIAFMQALPQLLDLLNRLGNWMTANSIQTWMSELEVQIDLLEKAKTPDEKLKAAQGLLNSMRGLGK